MSEPTPTDGTSSQVESENELEPIPLSILILGGTGFIGPCFVRAALDRGHRVSIFNRGKRKTDIPNGVERLVGDRSGSLESIRHRDWDAVIDLATFVPSWVRGLGEVLEGRVNHYTFISTAAVYEVAVDGQPLTEASRLRNYERDAEDPYLLTGPKDPHEYGALKAMCELEAETQFPGRTLILRPGHIVGPREPGGYLTYWPLRVEKAGDEMLVPGDPWMPIQFIDARDLAEWSIRMIEESATGTYNAIGPATTSTLGEVVSVARHSLQPSAKPAWVPSSWLASQKGSELWEKPLFWSYDSKWQWCFRGIDNNRALANGLTFRPLSTTLADALASHQAESDSHQSELAVLTSKESGDLERATLSWSNYLEREKEVLAAWRAEQAKQPTAQESEVTTDQAGVVHVPSFRLPLSIYMSPEAQRLYITERLQSPPFEMSNDVATFRTMLDRVFYDPKLEKAKAIYPVSIEQKTIGGVRTFATMPSSGVSNDNESCILISLHSGDFRVGAGVLQLIESVPFAATSKIKVISVDYRQAPEFTFPAASEDVAAVYQELLKHYEPQNIGLYGNSTGATLAAMTLAWLQLKGLPRPGAVGLISKVHASLRGGDSFFTAPPLFPQFGFRFSSPSTSANGSASVLPYLADADLSSPVVSPTMHPNVLSQFPPSLLITGTRDSACSSTLDAHRQLVNLGVQAELRVWEGMWQHFIHDVDLPESKEAYEAMASFFHRHLGKTY